jgi:hypothetical protein
VIRRSYVTRPPEQGHATLRGASYSNPGRATAYIRRSREADIRPWESHDEDFDHNCDTSPAPAARRAGSALARPRPAVGAAADSCGETGARGGRRSRPGRGAAGPLILPRTTATSCGDRMSATQAGSRHHENSGRSPSAVRWISWRRFSIPRASISASRCAVVGYCSGGNR